MTGLIWKDYLVMRKALKSYLFILVAYVALAYLEIINYGFIITFIQLLLMIMPISAFAFDEQAKWDRYAMALPLGTGKVVGARYLFVLGLALFTMAVGLAGSAILWAVGADDVLETVLTVLVSSGIGLLIPSILLPLSYKMGSERARPFLYAIVFIPTIVVVLLAKMEALDLSSLNRLDTLPPAALIGGASLLPLGGLAVLFISYLTACRIAAAKEY